MTASPDFSYAGDELRVFEGARNWKAYFSQHLKAYIAGDVAEVGAGIGGTTAALWNESIDSWLCIEPDANQAAAINEKIRLGELPSNCLTMVGRLGEGAPAQFDTIVYIDVLEHIEDDRREIDEALQRLRPGGHLVILVPAFQLLYSEFDRHLGHFRRYTVRRLISITPNGSELIKAHYLDCVGFLLSLANRLVLKSKLPTRSQIAFWDGSIIPLSRHADRFLSAWIGRSAIAVWRRT
jgi:SAM-dependent methyltransferase